MHLQNPPSGKQIRPLIALLDCFRGSWRFDPILLLILFIATSGVAECVDLSDWGAMYQRWGLPSGTAIVSAACLIFCAILASVTPFTRLFIGLAGFVLLAISLGSIIKKEDDAVIEAAWSMGPFLAIPYGKWRWPAYTYRSRAIVLFAQWMFLIAAVMNFVGFDDYSKWGYPSWWNYVSAGYEMSLVILFLFSSTERVASIGAVALMFVILGTIVLHHSWLKLVDFAYYVPAVAAVCFLRRNSS